jgi:hypothetical protein
MNIIITRINNQLAKLTFISTIKPHPIMKHTGITII